MQRFFVCIISCVLSNMVAFAQSENQIRIAVPISDIPLKSISTDKRRFSNDSISLMYQISPDIFSRNLLLQNPIIDNVSKQNYDLSKTYKFKSFNLTPYNQRILNIGLGNVNNVGVSITKNISNKISLEGNAFISQQYGYIQYSKHTSLGIRMNIDYHFDNKLIFSLWAQHLSNRNNDPFVKSMNLQPKTGMGIRLEYNPNYNTRFSIDIGKQEGFIDSKKYNYIIEGKAGFKF